MFIRQHSKPQLRNWAIISVDTKLNIHREATLSVLYTLNCPSILIPFFLANFFPLFIFGKYQEKSRIYLYDKKK